MVLGESGQVVVPAISPVSDAVIGIGQIPWQDLSAEGLLVGSVVECQSLLPVGQSSHLVEFAIGD